MLHGQALLTTQNEAQKSGDLVVATFFSGDNNLFTFTGEGDAKGSASELPETKTPTYFLVGDEWGNWNASDAGAIALTNPVNGKYTVDVTNTKASGLKIVDTANNIWYGKDSIEGGAANFMLYDVHTYTITFDPAGPTYISCVVKA